MLKIYNEEMVIYGGFCGDVPIRFIMLFSLGANHFLVCQAKGFARQYGFVSVISINASSL